MSWIEHRVILILMRRGKGVRESEILNKVVRITKKCRTSIQNMDGYCFRLIELKGVKIWRGK